MNALLPVFLVLVLFGGEKTKSVTELLSRIDFASFRPVFNLLGVNGKTVDFLCSEGKCRFSRNRLNTFSTSTMASSTSEPIAMAIPPRLIVFMVSPINLRVSTDITNDKGMVTSEISVVLTFIRKMKR